MAKASMTLPDGTTVQINGSAEEIRKIIYLRRPQGDQLPLERTERKYQETFPKGGKSTETGKIDLSSIVNALKSSNEVELIEKNILDRISMVDRILAPLYIVHKHFSDKRPMTSGEISKFLSQLGLTIHTANVSNTLSSTASKYVMSDKVRVKGQPTHYRLSRRGLQYISSLIREKADA